MFNNNTDVKVLESKLSIYEELSREMLAKLENAVDKISESNARIANILTKHDERIDQSARSDELIMKMIEDHKKYDNEMFEKISDKFETVDTEITNLSKFRWQSGAIIGAVMFAVAVTSPIVLTYIDNIGKMEEKVVTLP